MINSSNNNKGEGKVRSRLKVLIAQKEVEKGSPIRQGEIATATGLNEHTISRWMRPEPFARIETDAAVKLCKFLGCEIGELLYIDWSESA